MVHTPQSSVAEQHLNVVNTTVLPPPLPSVIGGNRPSPSGGGGGSGSFHYDGQDRTTPELQGEYLIESSENETKATATPGTSNLTSMVSASLVGSSLPLESLVSNPPSLTQKNKLSFSTIATDSVQGHSRDSSLTTNPSTMHSRDNSLLTPNPSWLSAGGGGGGTPSPRDESAMAQTAPTSALPSHPLATLSQPQQSSPHPSSSSKKNNVTLIQRPPLPPSNDMNVSLLSESGMDDSSKKQSLDLISEETTPDRTRASTTGLFEEEQSKRNHSRLPISSGSGQTIMSTTMSKFSEVEDGQVESKNDACEETSNNAMDEIQKTHFVRVSFVVPISERSLTSIKSGARTQVSLLRRGECCL